MAKDHLESDEPYSADRLFQLTISANQIAGCNAHVNSYEMRNAMLEERRRTRVRYKNGITLPAAQQSFAPTPSGRSDILES